MEDYKNKFENLQIEYDILKQEHSSLKHEYSENVVIESMNDMKKKYESMLKTTISLYRYQVLDDKCKRLIRGFSGCSVLIDHVIRALKQIDINSLDRRNILYKIELELITVSEILQDCNYSDESN